MNDEPRSWQFESPNRFTVGASGEPGSRVFYFQVFADGTEVEIKCEKPQAVALADHLIKLLDDLPPEPDSLDEEAVASLPPHELAWVVGSISIGVDRANSQLVVLFEEIVFEDPYEDGDDPLAPQEEPGRLRVHLSPRQVRGFARQVEALTAQSRPLCRLCEQPIDPSGHACPRLN